MKKLFSTLIAALALTCATASAQALISSYFLDNSQLRNRLNPAFAPRSNHFGLPVLSNTGVGLYGNIGPADFLYPKDGKLYTFLNKNVTVEEFASRLATNPGLDLDFNTDILNFGFYTSPGSYWSFDMGLQLNASVGVPHDLFIFLKQGMSQASNTYSLSGFNVFADANIYAAIGHSRDLSNVVPGLSIGAKVKFLASLASVGMDLGKSSLQLSEDAWKVNVDATGTIAAPYLKMTAPTEAGTLPSFAFDQSKISPAGFGFAVDLGAAYRLSVGSVVDGLTFSFSALDLGAIFYKASNVQRLVSKNSASYIGFNDIAIGEDANFDQMIEGLKNDFLKLADFQEAAAEKMSLSTCPKIYAGVEMPFVHDMMSVGLLYSGKFGRRQAVNELTLSYNLNPCKWFNLGISWSFLNSWKTLGWVMELTPKAGVSFFVGSDYTFFQVMPTYMLPVDKVWANARFGLNFTLGSKHCK